MTESTVTPIKVYDNAYLNDCRYCIYFPTCYGISRGGKLAKLKCIILGWKSVK